MAYDDYDDGFDDPESPEQEDLSEEERSEIRKGRIRLLFGAGKLTGIIAGSVVILLLLALLFSMVNFLIGDISKNFTLLLTRL